ncbi:MAG: DedA family protein [Planctomycetes bacterium]|nr:DedA family protein [Planctomycetota bacterium]
MMIGYPGIIILMAIESSFIPFPSEIIIPPAGYLASAAGGEKMSLALIILCGIFGSLIGAFVNYYIAVYAGRPFVIKYGRYFLITEDKLEKCEEFFKNHGEITTFVGRLIPMIRQLISFPAGLARMNLAKFTLYTTLGAGIWVIILAFIGYWVGNNMELVEKYLQNATVWMLGGVIVLVLCYIKFHSFRKKRRAAKEEE